VVIYDRFIWSTYVKYNAFRYPVKPIAAIYLAPRPTTAVVLDIPVDRSLRVIGERLAHIHYPGEVLDSERQQYLQIARRHGYPVLEASADFDYVQEKIESLLGPLFPARSPRSS
jgi:thymidylate kinase